MANKVVLIVDDTELNRKVVKTVLMAQGFDVLEAQDGEEAITMATEHLPDMVLMDVQLPKLDGYEATRRLRAQESTRDLPIIALTAHAMPGESERATEAGCNGYISKPINTRTLVEQINEHLK